MRTRRLTHVLDGLWYAASAPLAFVVLGALLAGTLTVAAIFPQQPAGLDGPSVEQWLATTASSYRGMGPFLRTVGVFTVLSGAWIRVLVAALACHLALRLTTALRDLRSDARRSSASPATLPIVRSAVALPLATAANQVSELLRSRYETVTVESDGSRAQLYAVTVRPGRYGPVLLCLGGLLVALGLLVDDAAGWHTARIALAPGGAVTLTHASDLQLMLNEGSGASVGSHWDVTVTRDHHGANIRVGFVRPGRWGNLWLAEQSTGQALAISATEGSGRPLLLQSLTPGGEVAQTLHILFRQTQSEQGFAIPTRNLTFRAVSYPALPERGFDGPVFLVEAYVGEDATPVLRELVADERAVMLDDVALSLRRDRYVVLNAAYLPGLVPALIGGVLILAGVVLMFFWPMTRAWLGLAGGSSGTTMVIRAETAALASDEATSLQNALQGIFAAETRSGDGR